MDPDAKLFYRKILDFGPGVGMREGQRKYEEEKRREEEMRRILNEDVAMDMDSQNFLKLFLQSRFA
tara:strand:+ start:210 stop:407 length:198 start_codon:yes stop_codon:yes gene_type:complete